MFKNKWKEKFMTLYWVLRNRRACCFFDMELLQAHEDDNELQLKDKETMRNRISSEINVYNQIIDRMDKMAESMGVDL